VFILVFLLFHGNTCVTALDGCRLHAEWRGIDLDARTHGGADRGASHVLAFGHGRFRLDHRRNQARRVFHQLVGREADFANRGVDDAGLVDAELHLAGLDFMDCLDHIHRDRARLRVGHQASRTQHLTELADGAHHVGSGDHGVKIGPTFGLNLVDHVFATNEIRACFLRFAQFVAAGDHQHLFRLAEAIRHEDGAADHLVGVLGIDTETHMYFHGLVELCVLDFLDKRNGLFQEVILGFDLLLRGLILFTRFACHVSSLVQAVRSKRAYEPPTERYRKGQHVVYQMEQSRVYLESDLAAMRPQCTLNQLDPDGAMRKPAVDGAFPGIRRLSDSSAEDPDRPGLRPALQFRFQTSTRYPR